MTDRQDSYPVHPVAELFPLMEGQEYATLLASIRDDGLLEAIQIYRGLLVDGRNRLRACLELGIAPRYVEADVPEGMPVSAWIVARNLIRRHLTPHQAAKLAMELRQYVAADLPEGTSARTIDKAVADSVGVSETTLWRARQVAEHGTPELQEMALDREEIPLREAAELAKLPASDQVEAVQRIGSQAARGEKPARAAAREASKKKEFVQKPLKDALGNDVPQGLRDVFGDDSRKDVLDFVGTSLRWVQKHRGIDPWLGENTRVQGWLEMALSTLEASVPHAVCEGCGGTGRREKKDAAGRVSRQGCHDCRTTGWLPRWAYEDWAKRKEEQTDG